jgi:hypothetical protein
VRPTGGLRAPCRPQLPMQSSPKLPGSSSLLVMLFDRTCEFETVYRNSGRNMSQPPHDLRHKGIQAAFTKSDEDPGGPGHV